MPGYYPIVEIKNYRAFILKEMGIWGWRLLPLDRAAYVQTGKIIDTGIEVQAGAGFAYYMFDCRTSLVVQNCYGANVRILLYGTTKSGTNKSEIQEAYAIARKACYEANPAPLMNIDIRSLGQLCMGCCPQALWEQEFE